MDFVVAESVGFLVLKNILHLKNTSSQAVIVHTFNSSIQEKDVGKSLTSKLAWLTEIDLGQSRLHKEILF